MKFLVEAFPLQTRSSVSNIVVTSDSVGDTLPDSIGKGSYHYLDIAGNAILVSIDTIPITSCPTYVSTQNIHACPLYSNVLLDNFLDLNITDYEMLIDGIKYYDGTNFLFQVFFNKGPVAQYLVGVEIKD